MINMDFSGANFRFSTEPDLFSPNAADTGTCFMLECAWPYLSGGNILDLGCGYGVAGIVIAKMNPGCNVYMSDINEAACACTRRNVELNDVNNTTVLCCDGVPEIENTEFSMILANPPYHADFSVAKNFVEKGFKALATGGRMVLVIKRLAWYQNKMKSCFGGVRVFEQSGYYVLVAEKRKHQLPAKAKKTTTRKHRKKTETSCGKKQ